MSSPIHIVHLTTHLGRGGAASNVLLSCIGLAEEGYRVSLLHGPTEKPEAELIQRAEQAGVAFHSIPSLQREIHPIEDWRVLSEIRALLRDDPPEILHTHQSKAGLLGTHAAKRIPDLPVVHTPHGHVFYGYFPKWKTNLFITLEKRAAKWRRLLIGLTRIEVEDHLARGIGVRDQWKVVHSGIELGRVRQEAERRIDIRGDLKLESGTPVIASLGRLEPVKGILEFLPHFKACVDLGAEVHWAIFGEGSQKSSIEETVHSLNLENRVHLMGWLKEPFRVLADCDALLLPSRNEGMGRVVIEAFALGAPVFGASVGSTAELVSDKELGVLFDWERPDRIAASLGEFLDHLPDSASHREKRIARARAYSVESMVEKLQECYEDLVRTELT